MRNLSAILLATAVLGLLGSSASAGHIAVTYDLSPTAGHTYNGYQQANTNDVSGTMKVLFANGATGTQIKAGPATLTSLMMTATATVTGTGFLRRTHQLSLVFPHHANSVTGALLTFTRSGSTGKLSNPSATTATLRFVAKGHCSGAFGCPLVPGSWPSSTTKSSTFTTMITVPTWSYSKLQSFHKRLSSALLRSPVTGSRHIISSNSGYHEFNVVGKETDRQ